MSAAEAVFRGETTVEGLRFAVQRGGVLPTDWSHVPIWIDPDGAFIHQVRPQCVVDAIVAKRNTGTSLDMAPLVIGLGPGFTAGKDVHYVIETKRGHFLGRVIDHGCAIPNTGVPGIIGGEGERRVIRSPGAGFFAAQREIGESVSQGDFLGYVGDIPITANITGLIRGLIHPTVPVHKGMKIGDIDPRNEEGSWQTISDKAFSIAGGVVEAMFNTHTYEGALMPLHCAEKE